MPVSMKKKWVIAPPIPEQVIQELRDYPPLLRQLLYNRGITDAASARDFMDAAPSRYDPFLLCDMEVAVERLLQAVDRQEKIAVYGDYDVDGVTSTVLLVQVLRRLGANVREYIPNRFDEGYGLNREAISHLAEMGVRLVVTVDCGIRSPEEVEHAHSLGVDVIISDHHHPQETLPAALAVVCHRRPDNTYPDTNLAGVGLAYKIAQALLSRRPVPGVEAEDWLDLVALGTVADLVPLTGENRKLVRAGLNRMRLGYRQGLVSLAQAAGVSLPRVTANEIAYYLGPRLNAAGRLESALAAFELLNSDDVFQTGMLAQRLDDQNRERQKLTLQTQVQAEACRRRFRRKRWPVKPGWRTYCSPSIRISIPALSGWQRRSWWKHITARPWWARWARSSPGHPAAASPSFTSPKRWMPAGTCWCGTAGMPWRPGSRCAMKTCRS